MSLVFLLSIFLAYRSTFICSLSLSLLCLCFFHTQSLIEEVSDSHPIHFFPFIVSLGHIFGLPFKLFSIEFGQRRRKKEFKRDEKVEIIGEG